ncbi:hypothetical protein RDI58_000045 [Solanum bulbocastanum]|uniref:CASP-like protein n=1 Tax=Solanum bulbocastanum TaxID=147425 RepID=A0AAN8U9F2_SOLBU
MVEYDYDEKPSSSFSSSNKIPLIVVIARVVTLASLLISSLVMYNNEVPYMNTQIDYHLFETFRFVFGIMIMGICYTVLLLPFAAYYMIAKKQLIDHHMFHLVQLIADKIMFGLLATAAGASLGVTVEFQKRTFIDGTSGAKMHSYFSLMYVPNAFFVVGLVGSLISTILSSLNFNKSE